MSKARARGAARKGVTEELDVIAEESDGEEGEAQAARVLAGLEKLDSVLEVVTRSEQVAATQGAALASTVASVQALSEQVAKLAQAQATASVSTPRGRAGRGEGAHDARGDAHAARAVHQRLVHGRGGGVVRNCVLA